MSPKKLLTLFLISFVGSAALLYLLRIRPAPQGIVPPAPSKAADSVNAAPTQTAAHSLVRTEPAPSGALTRIPGSGWGKNPFLTIEEVQAANRPPVSITEETPLEPQVETGPQLPAYVVTAILRSAIGYRAILDDRVVQTGDQIGQETVKEIKAGIVVLDHAGKTRELPLRRFEDAIRPGPKGEKP